VLVAAAATSQGWRVTYLGPSLPAEEIVGAAVQNRSKAVCLSIVYPEDDPNIINELRRLRQLLPPEIIIMVGGRASRSYLGVLQEIRATVLKDLTSFYDELEVTRRTPMPQEQPSN
jgi:methylmalonyl-CoA mutase cobalamin-binding subunit